MAANSPDSPSLNEKAGVPPAQPQKKKGFFSRKQAKTVDPVDDEKPKDGTLLFP